MSSKLWYDKTSIGKAIEKVTELKRENMICDLNLGEFGFIADDPERFYPVATLLFHGGTITIMATIDASPKGIISILEIVIKDADGVQLYPEE
jgi:hypothetical protein